MEFWNGGTRVNAKFSLGVPIYYSMLGKKLFGDGIKYPLWRFAGVPDRLIRKHMYLDFTGHKRNRKGMAPFEKEIQPGFKNVREQGLQMIDATELHHLQRPLSHEAAPAAGD